MALASTPDLASYGFGYRWAQQAYAVSPTATFGESSIKTGNTTWEGDKPHVDIFTIQGANGTLAMYPAYMNGANSIIDGGSKMGGLEVVNGAIDYYLTLSYALTQDLSNSIRSIQSTLFNLYTLQSPSVNSDTESKPIKLSRFYNYNFPIWAAIPRPAR